MGGQRHNSGSEPSLHEDDPDFGNLNTIYRDTTTFCSPIDVPDKEEWPPMRLTARSRCNGNGEYYPANPGLLCAVRRLAAYDSPPTDRWVPLNAVSVDDPNYQRDLRRLKTSEGRRRLAPHDSPPTDGWGPWKAVPVDHPNYQRDLRRFLASKAADRNC